MVLESPPSSCLPDSEPLGEEHETEFWFYALDVACLQDLPLDSKVMQRARLLRVMHCNSLSSLRGTTLFPQLQELNASSNQLLSMAGVEELISPLLLRPCLSVPSHTNVALSAMV